MKNLVRSALVCLLVPFGVAAQDAGEDDSDDDGGGFLERTIEGALSGAGRDVKIVGFRGALSSEATFDSMTISDDQGVWLTLEDVALNWRRAALLRGRLNVDSLTAGSLEIARLPEPGEEPAELPSAEAEPFSFELPELPVSINITAFEVAEITLGEPVMGQAARLSLQASARFDDEGLFADLSADRIDDVAGVLGLKTTILRDGAEIDVDLTLEEAQGGIAALLLNLPDRPSVDLTIAGVGQIDDFTADIGLRTDDTPRLDGQVSLSMEEAADAGAGPDRRIRADLGGDITALIAPEYQDFFGPDVSLQVDTLLVSDGSIDVQDFKINAQAVDLAGKVRLNNDLWPSFVDVEGEISQNGAPVVLPGSDNGITVQSITLDVDFDETAGDAFTGRFNIFDFRQEAITLADTALELDGVLSGGLEAIGQFAADITLDVSGVEFADADSGQAIGDAIKGGLRVNYVQDQPFEISNIALSGVDYGLSGDVVIQTFDEGIPTDLTVDIAAQDLSRFSALAGQSLGGAADISISGRIVPLSTMFDLTVSANAVDLVTGIEQADAVLAGATSLSAVAERSGEGTFLRNLVLLNDALDVRLDAELRSGGSAVDAAVQLADLALVVPEYQGPVALNAQASQSEAGWQVDASLDAPYDSRAVVSGLATGPDADLVFDISIPEVSNYAAQAKGPLAAKGRVWQSPEGYRIDVEAGGPFDAALDVEGLATGPDARVQFDASVPDLSVLVPNFGGAFALAGDLSKSGEDWLLDSQLEGPAGLNALIAGTAAPDASTLDMTVRGALPLGLASPILAPRTIAGLAEFDLAVNGPPALESLSGRITTSDALFSAPNLKLGLQNIATRVDLAGNAMQLDVGADFVTGGRVTVDGSLNLASLSSDLSIALQNAVFIDPKLYSAEVGADINVNGPLTGGARISGVVNLGEVNVTVPGTGVTSIGAIPEIVHRAASGAVSRTQARAGVLPPEEVSGTKGTAPPFPLAIQINAPSKIFVRGRGINAEMGGDFSIGGDTNNIISAGSLDLIRGRLDIIGKRFELDEGSIQFQGSVTPYILFVTTTQIPDGTASITVEGLANEPEITFSSDPEAPEDEVMSLILFGRYISELSAFQALQLANGVSQLTGRSGINVLGNLREGIGLDELDVTTDGEGATSVSAGKYITDTIYTDVTNNSEKGTDISINIDLTDALTGRATVGEDNESSIGLFFERDY